MMSDTPEEPPQHEPAKACGVMRKAAPVKRAAQNNMEIEFLVSILVYFKVSL